MTRDVLLKAAEMLRELGIEAEAPDQSGNIPGFQDRLVLNIRGICVDEFSDWVSIELRHLDPNSDWFDETLPCRRIDSSLNSKRPGHAGPKCLVGGG